MTSAFDGEAPETDDEIDEKVEINEEKQRKDEKKLTPKKQFPIDKKLKNRWSQVAVETINYCQKRDAPAEKTMQKVTESDADCFTSMQNVAAKLNLVQSNVARLEDSVADLLEASQLIPSKFPTLDLKIPEFL